MGTDLSEKRIILLSCGPGHAPLFVVGGVAEGLAHFHFFVLLLFFVELNRNGTDRYFLIYMLHLLLYNFIIYILSMI